MNLDQKSEITIENDYDDDSTFFLRKEELLTCCGGLEWIFHTEEGWIGECVRCGRTGVAETTPRRAAQAWRVVLAGLRGFSVRRI